MARLAALPWLLLLQPGACLSLCLPTPFAFLSRYTPCSPCAAAGAVAALLLGLNVARTYQDKLRQFLADVAGDQVLQGSGGSGQLGKAD